MLKFFFNLKLKQAKNIFQGDQLNNLIKDKLKKITELKNAIW